MRIGSRMLLLMHGEIAIFLTHLFLALLLIFVQLPCAAENLGLEEYVAPEPSAVPTDSLQDVFSDIPPDYTLSSETIVDQSLVTVHPVAVKLKAANVKPAKTLHLNLANYFRTQAVANQVHDLSLHSAPARNSPLSVLSVNPVGTHTFADSITIAFSAPMVPSSIVGKPLTMQKLVEVVPLQAGRWRWLEQQVLRFEPASGHIARATHYDLKVPTGAKSLAGQLLQTSIQWSFELPPPELIEPTGGISESSDFVPFVFHQPVIKSSVLAHTHLFVDERSIPLRLATIAECNTYSTEWSKREGAVGLVATERLPATGYKGRLVVDAGIASPEGPLKSKKVVEQPLQRNSTEFQLASESTMDLTQVPTQQVYQAGEPWRIEFNGPSNGNCAVIERRYASQSMIHVDPPIKNFQVKVNQVALIILGDTKANTKYTVTISERLPGCGCKLGKDRTVTVEVLPRAAQLVPPSSPCVWIDPNGPQDYPIHSINVQKIRVRAYSFDKSVDFTGEPRMPYADNLSGDLSGETLADQVIPIANSVDELVSTDFNLRPLVARGIHQCFLKIEKVDEDSRWSSPVPAYIVWLQLTKRNATQVVSSDVNALIFDRHSGKVVDDDVTVTALPAGQMHAAQPGVFGPYDWAKHPIAGVSARGVNDEAITLIGTGPQTKRETAATKYIWSGGIVWYLVGPGNMGAFRGRLLQIGKNDRRVIPHGYIQYVATDSRNIQFASGVVPISETGAFFAKFRASTSIGRALIKWTYLADANAPSASQEIGFEIKPNPLNPVQQKMHTSSASHSHSFVAGDLLTTSVELVQNATGIGEEPIQWVLYSRPARFAPPGWDAFKFGHTVFPYDDSNYYRAHEEAKIESSTDNSGAAAITFSPTNFKMHESMLILIQASNHFSQSDRNSYSTSIVVHPSTFFIGLRPQSRLNADGTTLINLDCLVTDVDGKQIGDQEVNLKVLKSNGDLVPIAQSSIKTELGITPFHFILPTHEPVSIIASTQDPNGRLSETTIAVGNTYPPLKLKHADLLKVFPDKQTYGEDRKCILYFDCPFTKFEGFVALSTNKGTVVKRVSSEAESRSCEVSIPEHVSGKLEGLMKLYDTTGGDSTPSVQNARAALGMFNINVFVDKQLRVQIENPNRQLTAGTDNELSVTVRDAKGNVVQGADVSLLTGEGMGVLDAKSEFPEQELQEKFHPFIRSYSADGVLKSESADASFNRVLSRFESADKKKDQPTRNSYNDNNFDNLLLTLFHAVTDKKGVAHFSVPVETKTDRFKVDCFVSSTDPNALGGDCVRFNCRSPFVVSGDRAAFIYPGDQMAKVLVLKNNLNTSQLVSFNLTAQAKVIHFQDIPLEAHESVKLFIDHSELLEQNANFVFKSKDVTVTIPAGILHQSLPIFARQSLDLANSDLVQFEYTGKDRKSKDKFNMSTIEAFANSATSLVNRDQEDFDYCASRVATLVTLRRFLKDDADKIRLDALINSDVNKLTEGFGPGEMWVNQSWLGDAQGSSPGLESPTTFPHILEALSLAVVKGYVSKPRNNLDLSRVVTSDNKFRDLPNDDLKLNAFAYSCYVASLVKKLQPDAFSYCPVDDQLQRLLSGRKIDTIPLEAICWLSLASQQLNFIRKDEFLQELSKRSSEIDPLSAEELDWLHDSVIRKRSALLKALVHCQPDSASIGPLAEKLVANLKSNKWKVCSDVDCAIIALAEYDEKFPSLIGPKLKLAQSSTSLTEGPSVSNSFAVRRDFKADTPTSKVWRDASGVWHAKSGAKVRASISFVPFRRLSHFILSDYFGGGFVVQSSSLTPGEYYAPMVQEADGASHEMGWYQKTNSEQNHVNVFASNLDATKYTYSYLMIAGSPGSYFIPPAVAMDPYDRTCTGYSASDRFIIEP